MGIKRDIHAEDGNIFEDGLGDQDPIERVLVVQWQCLNRSCVLQGEREQLEIIGG